MSALIQLRDVVPDDAKQLLVWRNDETTRRASHQMNTIGLDDHKIWLKASISNPCRLLYIASFNNEDIGTVRADYLSEQAAWELSWTLAPDKRGLGLAKQMVLALVNVIEGAVCAEIKEDNLASVRIAEFAGLSLIKRYDGILSFYLAAK